MVDHEAVEPHVDMAMVCFTFNNLDFKQLTKKGACLVEGKSQESDFMGIFFDTNNKAGYGFCIKKNQCRVSTQLEYRICW